MNCQWKMKASCTFFDGIYILGTMKIAILHVKKKNLDVKNERFFVTFFAPSVYRESSKVVIFQGEHDDDFAWKMHDFWAILMLIHIPGTCFFPYFRSYLFLPVNYATHLNPPWKPQNANPPSQPKHLKYRWVDLRKVAEGGLTHFVTAPANPFLKIRGGGA